MRPRIEWMTQADERVLEFLYEKDIVASPSVIAANIDYTSEYISRRCQKLADAELLQPVDPTNYRITELGERYLEGDIDPSEVEPVDGG
ncbi:MarR family transcriptional regulator [Halobacterium sp. CBA1126]|uniref:MarR family transcriptional regulator n=1 Tax=Halobacterium sp. CBA1126 TaxID=2668074 RepID=UPI0012F97D75|nr:MarR family transcriptional regulator [Halobacterium sp. CBA1126]MUV60619.1 MarR family transcriptional regulator [Halobacterium sp. CBA1126]